MRDWYSTRMKLHRVSGEPDWSAVATQDRNTWQRLASASKGVVTPGNVVTVLGLTLVILGLIAIDRHDYWLGLILLAIGRLADLLDGWLADRTGTKSPLGEAADVLADKAATIFTLAVFFMDKLVPWPLLGLALLPHLIITLLPLTKSWRQHRLHPSRAGKLSMAMLWVSIPGVILALALDSDGDWLKVVFEVGLVVSTVLNFYSVSHYLRQQD